MIYRNQDSITAAIVITKEVDLFECGQFFEAFFVAIEQTVLGRKSASTPTLGLTNNTTSMDLEKMYAPF